MERIDHYQVRGELARGAMGVVYRAHDPNLGRDVAIKVILDAELADATDLARFQTEAQVMAQLLHPNVVPILGAGATAGRPYLVMELVEGGSLAGRLKRQGRLPPREAVRVAHKIAEALGHAHQLGIVHRDVKPENILFDRHDEPRLTDFGIAKVLGIERGLTVTGEVLGTPYYMAPEAAQGDKSRVGPATDVYALGAVLFHMLTGEVPFSGASMFEVLDRVLTSPTPRARERVPELEPELDALCAEAMAKDLDERIPEAGALAARLATLQEPEERARGGGASSVAVGVACLVIGLISGGAGGAWLADRGPAATPPTPSPASPSPASTTPDTAPQPPQPEPTRSTSSAAVRAAAQSLITEARLQSERGRTLVALRLLEVAERLAPQEASIYAVRGLAVWTRSENHSKPERTEAMKRLNALLQRAAELDPNSGVARMARAYARGTPESEKPALMDEAVRLEADSAWLQYARAVVYKFEKGGEREVIGSLNRALEINPDYLAARIWRAAIRERARDDAGALRDLDAAVKIDPRSSQAYVRRGAIHLRLSRLRGWELQAFTRGIEDCTHAEITATHPSELLSALRLRAKALFAAAPKLSDATPGGKLHRRSAALRDVERALGLEPTHAETLYLKGEVLRSLRRWEGACDAYRGAIRNQPDARKKAAYRRRLAQAERALRKREAR